MQKVFQLKGLNTQNIMIVKGISPGRWRDLITSRVVVLGDSSPHYFSCLKYFCFSRINLCLLRNVTKMSQD